MESLDRKMRARADDLAWRRAANRGRSNRAWEWIVGVVFVFVIIFTGYRLVQTQQHLETTQSELENAKQEADQAKAQATELAKRGASLNSELEKSNAQRNELQTKFDRATSTIKSAQSQLEPAKSGVGGGILAVSPGKFGIAVISPPLDDAGNSIRAQRAIADISNALGGNPYAPRK